MRLSLISETKRPQGFSPDSLHKMGAKGETFIYVRGKWIADDIDVNHTEMLDQRPNLLHDFYSQLSDRQREDIEVEVVDGGADYAECVRLQIESLDGVFTGRYGWVKHDSRGKVASYPEAEPRLAFWTRPPRDVVVATAKHFDLPPETLVSFGSTFKGTIADFDDTPTPTDQSAFVAHLAKDKVKQLQDRGWTPKARTPGLMPGQKLWALNSESTTSRAFMEDDNQGQSLKDYFEENNLTPDTFYNESGKDNATFICVDGKLYHAPSGVTHQDLMDDNRELLQVLFTKANEAGVFSAEDKARRPAAFRSEQNDPSFSLSTALGTNLIYKLRKGLGGMDGIYVGRYGQLPSHPRQRSNEEYGLAFWNNPPGAVISKIGSYYGLGPETYVITGAGRRFWGTLGNLGQQEDDVSEGELDTAPTQRPNGPSKLEALHLDRNKVKKLQDRGWKPKERTSGLVPGQKLWALNSESKEL